MLGVWGLLTGLCAIVLLIAGGLQALQQTALLSAVPFTIIATLLGISLVKELRRDARFVRRAEPRRTVDAEPHTVS
nr:BCCT family transporter [Nesterenkonia sp. AN1]